MQSLTLGLAGAASMILFFLKPAQAVGLYIAVLMFYPSYLTVQVGTIDISVGRILVMVLFLKGITNAKLRARFKWSVLDNWVAAYMVITTVLAFAMSPAATVLESRAGALMDTWLSYMVVRLCISSRSDLLTVIKWVAVILFPLAVLGVLESCTGWRPYGTLRQYCLWRSDIPVKPGRFGFDRALGAFSHSIMFGVSFCIFLPLIFMLRHKNGYWRPLAYFLSGAAVVGALSSISSGPWIMVLVAILCLAMEKKKRWIKRLLVVLLCGCVFIGMASNRPFYHVIASYSNPLSGSGYHRAALIDCAVKDFSQWYIAGYGGKDPGWGDTLGMVWTDITNHYILIGVKYGFLGLVIFCGIIITALRGLVHLYRRSYDPVIRAWAWGFGSSIFSILVVWFSVSFFGQPSIFFYCLLGMIGSLSILSVNSIGTRYRIVYPR